MGSHATRRLHSVQRRRAGAEGAFGAQAERYGLDEVNFTFEGHALVRQPRSRVLNHEELLAGDISLEYVPG